MSALPGSGVGPTQFGEGLCLSSGPVILPLGSGPKEIQGSPGSLVGAVPGHTPPSSAARGPWVPLVILSCPSEWCGAHLTGEGEKLQPVVGE